MAGGELGSSSLCGASRRLFSTGHRDYPPPVVAYAAPLAPYGYGAPPAPAYYGTHSDR